jgi:hypothetical protein
MQEADKRTMSREEREQKELNRNTKHKPPEPRGKVKEEKESND